MNRELPASRQMKTPSKLMRFMWLIAALVLFAATLPIVAAFPTAPISYGYDRHVQSSIAYNRTSLVAFDYDSVPVSLADKMVNRSVGTSGTFAKSVKFLAADTAGVEGQTLYRGVWDDHPAFNDALEGNVTPRGGGATPLEHNLGNTASPYTSWTTDPALAAERAGSGGVVLQNTFLPSQLVTSPDLFGEGEVLVVGPVRGATATRVP